MIYSYTDLHDVDEESTSMSLYGGYWAHDKVSGVMNRHVDAVLSATGEIVASMKKK